MQGGQKSFEYRREQTIYEFIPQKGVAGNDTMPWS
jgi:hypothetical protein